MKWECLLLSCFLVVGCATTTSGFGPSSKSHIKGTLLFEDSVEFSEHLKNFVTMHPECQEREKIIYLLSAIRDSEAIFLRNNRRYTGLYAAKWLQWKKNHPQFRNDPIVTAWDFVNRVAQKSKKSGLPYQVIMPDGRQTDLQAMLRKELVLLESALKQHSLQHALRANLAKVPVTVQPRPKVDIQTPSNVQS